VTDFKSVFFLNRFQICLVWAKDRFGICIFLDRFGICLFGSKTLTDSRSVFCAKPLTDFRFVKGLGPKRQISNLSFGTFPGISQQKTKVHFCLFHRKTDFKSVCFTKRQISNLSSVRFRNLSRTKHKSAKRQKCKVHSQLFRPRNASQQFAESCHPNSGVTPPPSYFCMIGQGARGAVRGTSDGSEPPTPAGGHEQT